MVLKIEDARIRVTLDTKRAVEETRELEEQLEASRGGGAPRPGRGPGEREREARGRRPPSRATGAALGAGVGARVAAGGFRRAAGFVAGAAGTVSLIALIRELPQLIPALISGLQSDPRFRDFLQKEIIPDIPLVDFPGEGLTVGDTLVELGKASQAIGEKIAAIEGALATTIDSVRLFMDLTAEGKLSEAGAAGIKAFSHLRQGDFRGAGASLAGVSGMDEIEKIFDAKASYNEARAKFRYLAGEAEWNANVNRQLEAFRGGMNR